MDKKAREEFQMMLTAPLPGEETRPATAEQKELEGADFMAAMQQHQALVK